MVRTIRAEAVIQAEASSADLELPEDTPVWRDPRRRSRGWKGRAPGPWEHPGLVV